MRNVERAEASKSCARRYAARCDESGQVSSAHGALAADLLPPELRGIGYGVLGTVNGLGDLFSSIIVGLLWTHVTSAAGFGYAAVLGLAGALLILRVR